LFIQIIFIISHVKFPPRLSERSMENTYVESSCKKEGKRRHKQWTEAEAAFGRANRKNLIIPRKGIR
jgi:hypothetical protein